MQLAVRAVAAALILAQPLVAQSQPQTREGFTISVGIGGGSSGLTCSGCATDREIAVSGYLRMGGALHPNLILAAESNAWAKTLTNQGIHESRKMSFLTGVAQWYPQPEGGFYVKGGLGLGTVVSKVTDPTFGNSTLQSTGIAVSVGTGFDYRVGKNFSLSPFVNYLATTAAKAKLDGAPTGDQLNANLLQYGLGLTWH